MNKRTSSGTALILIGYQNDYFSPDGILHGVIEEVERVNHVLENTLALIRQLIETQALMVSTPIIFTEDYSELKEPVGILKVIKETKAFCSASKGSATIPEFNEFENRILEVPGKRGLNAFSNTQLDELLQERKIKDLVFAGAVTSVCIDSSARSAFERGYKVSVLSDCTTGRTMFEQEFYCNEIFPIYAEVLAYEEFVASFSDM
jgi:nicotinamidase-related amidase